MLNSSLSTPHFGAKQELKPKLLQHTKSYQRMQKIAESLYAVTPGLQADAGAMHFLPKVVQIPTYGPGENKG